MDPFLGVKHTIFHVMGVYEHMSSTNKDSIKIKIYLVSKYSAASSV